MEIAAEQFLRALAAGFLCGMIVSIPPGPIALAVINQALRRGFVPAFKMGLGGVCGDMIYASLMLAGHASVLNHPWLTNSMRYLAVAVMGGLSIWYLRFRPESLQKTEAKAEQVEERWHHPRSFFLGFAMTSTNLMLALLWATLAAFLFAHGWVRPEAVSRAGCLVGVFGGAITWFLAVSWFVALAHRRINPLTLTRLVRGCGALLLVMTVLFAWRVFGNPL